jgi:hypothetical protein
MADPDLDALQKTIGALVATLKAKSLLIEELERENAALRERLGGAKLN